MSEIEELPDYNPKGDAAYWRARAEKAEAELADWKDSYRRVIMEDCDSRETAEQHCTCVPHLRRRIAELEQERDAARAEAAMLREGGFIPVQAGYIVGWTRMSDREPTVDGLYDVWCDWCIRGVHPPMRAEWRYGEWNINGVTHWQPCPQGPEEMEK